MTELKILDYILRQLEERTEENPLTKEEIHWYANHLFKSSPRDRRSIMEKLVKDGFAGRIDLEGIDKYFITYDGLVFIKKNGYRGQLRRQNSKVILDYVLAITIAISGIVASIYYGHELLENRHPSILENINKLRDSSNQKKVKFATDTLPVSKNK